MADITLPFTYVIRKRGREYWRFRRGDLKAALPGRPGAPEFHARYSELVALSERRPRQIPRSSVEWLTREYRSSAEFRALAESTRADYAKTLDLIVAEMGDQPYRFVTRAMVKAVRDDYADTARKAHKIKQMVSRLYSWADENDLVPVGMNPARDIKRLKRQGGEREIVVWSDAEIDLFLRHCSAEIKTPVMIALYTGQRLSDVLRMTWTQYLGGVIRVRQSKRGAMLDIPCHTALRKHLDALKDGERGVQICQRGGKPWKPGAFGAALYRAVRAIDGMPAERSMHGLRYAAGSRMEEAGASVAEIEAVLGHRTFRMALKYASQRLRAAAAIAKMERANNA